MNKRIKLLRKELGITQEEFSSRIGLSRNFIAQIETGIKVPSERTINDICRIYSVDDNWLKNGVGEMFVKRSRIDEIGEFVNDVMEETDDSFKKRFLLALSKLNETDWETIAKIVENISDC